MAEWPCRSRVVGERVFRFCPVVFTQAYSYGRLVNSSEDYHGRNEGLVGTCVPEPSACCLGGVKCRVQQ